MEQSETVRFLLARDLHQRWGQTIDFIEEGGVVGVMRYGKLVAAIVPPDVTNFISHLRAIDKGLHPDVEHKADVHHITDRKTTKPYQAQCPCGWRGPVRQAFMGASREAVEHNKEMAKVKRKEEPHVEPTGHFVADGREH